MRVLCAQPHFAESELAAPRVAPHSPAGVDALLARRASGTTCCRCARRVAFLSLRAAQVASKGDYLSEADVAASKASKEERKKKRKERKIRDKSAEPEDANGERERVVTRSQPCARSMHK